MLRSFVAILLLVSSTTVAFSQEKCLTEKDVLEYVKQKKMVKARCYWNTNTAESEEEFQCVRTWVLPDHSYFSIESQLDCFVKPKHIGKAEMQKLYKVKKPVPPCDDCG